MSLCLELTQVTLHFGGIVALNSLSLQVRSGTIHGIIGPNGAGKSTLFNVITGFYRPQSGEVRYEDRSLLGLSTPSVARLGIMRTFQNIRLLSHLSVQQNMRVSTAAIRQGSFWSSFFNLPRARTMHTAIDRQIDTCLEEVGLLPHRNRSAGDLPYGEQRKLELARALLQKPRLLLLDEPAAGLNLTEKKSLASYLTQISGRGGMTILVIEHDLAFVQEICSELSVLDQGSLVTSGSPAPTLRNPRVITAYMGPSKKRPTTTYGSDAAS